MSITLSVFWSILQTFLLFAVGAVALRLNWLKREELPNLSRLAVDVFTPFLTFSKMTRGFDPYTQGQDALVMPLIGFGVMLVGFCIGWLCKGMLFYKNSARMRTLHHHCATNNYFFLPLIVIANLFGSDSSEVVLLVILNVGSTIGFWTLCIIAMAGSQSPKQIFKSLVSTNMLAIIAGLAFPLLRIPVPTVIDNTAGMLAEMAAPFTMILTGVSLTMHFNGLAKRLKDAVLVNLLRLIVIPAICVLILKWLPISHEAYQVGVIYALMPAAVISVLVASKYHGDEEFSGQSTIISTFLSLITVPAWVYFLF